MSGPTPRPWRVLDTRPMDINGNIIRIVDKDRFPMAFVPAWDEPSAGEIDGTEEAKANAAFIIEAVNNYDRLVAETSALRNALEERPVVSIKPMALSDGRTDYFVSIRVGDREVTPHVFRERYKSAYHVALYDWLLNGAGEEPCPVDFSPDDWPALTPASIAEKDEARRLSFGRRFEKHGSYSTSIGEHQNERSY